MGNFRERKERARNIFVPWLFPFLQLAFCLFTQLGAPTTVGFQHKFDGTDGKPTAHRYYKVVLCPVCGCGELKQIEDRGELGSLCLAGCTRTVRHA